MEDCTIIFYTASILHEPFARKVREQLLKASGGLPIISVSQKPLDFGENICVGDIGRSHLNIYHQILTGAKAAKTKYVAMAEDDILYSYEHYHEHIPSPNKFAYNMNKYSIFTWIKPPMYSIKNRRVVNALSCERDLLVDDLEERFAKFPDESKIPLSRWGDPGRYENTLGIRARETEQWQSTVPNVVFNHPEAFGFLKLGTRKSMGGDRRSELPYWGKAEDMYKMYEQNL